MNSSILLKFARIFIYTALLGVIIVMPSTFFPFIGGKYYFFRVAVELSLICVALWWAFEAKRGEFIDRLRRISSQPLFIAVSVFVLVYLLASLFANNPQGAFWSNYDRAEDGFQMLHYYLFFVLASFLFVKREYWFVAFRVSLVAAFLMIAYGIAANLLISGFITPYRSGDAPPTAWGKITSTRFQGSLGNPAYVAPYLLFTVFYALYLWLNKAWNSRILQAVLYGGLVLFYAFFLILSQTRGAFIGLAAALVVFLVIVAFLDRRLRKWALGGFVLLFLIGGMLFYFRNTGFVKSLPGSRVLEISLRERAFQTRLWTWNTALQGFRDRPVLGWGPENFSTVFDKYFDPRHYIPGQNTETWFDRAHSVFFDYLTETGILGLLSFIAIFLLFYIQFFKRLFSERSTHLTHDAALQLNSLQKALLFSLPIAYLVQGLVLFDVLPIYINLFLFLAFATFVFIRAPRELKGETSQKLHPKVRFELSPTAHQVIGVIIAVAVVGLGYYGSYLPLRKSQIFIATLQQTRNIKSVAEFKEAFSKPLDAASPIGQEELVRNLGQIILNIIQTNAGNTNPEVARELITFLGSYFDPIIERGRGMSFGQNLYILGALNEVAFAYTREQQYIEKSKQYYLKAFELGPKRPQPLYGLFDIHRLEGALDQVKAIADRILSQWPSDEQTANIYKQFAESQAKTGEVKELTK